MTQISIITPAYIENNEQLDWLDQAVQSVIKQDFADWEMIIINDKSPFPFETIVTKYQGDKRIRFLNAAQNQGPSLLRNTAVELAQSDCILPLDADDMLATTATLRTMFEHYKKHSTQKIIYGDLQRLQRNINNATIWETGKVFRLPDYNFVEGVMNLNGAIPVTAMHSRQCHTAAGGWKQELSHGLEDVEYWIAAGAKGFCGQRIDELILIYRRDENSRWGKLHQSPHLEIEARNKIITRHQGLFEGRYPMGCCGKSAVVAQNVSSQARLAGNVVQQVGNTVRLDPPLPAYNRDMIPVTYITKMDNPIDPVWVQYAGGRTGSFSINIGGQIPGSYNILGTGHVFQMHRSHLARLSREYIRNIPSPDTILNARSEENKQASVPPVNNGKPQMATLVQLDNVAAQTRPQQPQLKPILVPTPQPKPDPIEENYPLDVLDIGERFAHKLEAEGWTISQLAEATIDDLTPYPHIGQKRAETIIGSAKKWLEAKLQHSYP